MTDNHEKMFNITRNQKKTKFSRAIFSPITLSKLKKIYYIKC